jgi:hypothetical protein
MGGYLSFASGFLLGALVAAGPAGLAYYMVFRRLEWLALPRGGAPVPSGVQIRRPGAKRKPVIADDARAYAKEQEKA